MTEKMKEGPTEGEDPVLSRIGKFGKFQARVSPSPPHFDKWDMFHIHLRQIYLYICNRTFAGDSSCAAGWSFCCLADPGQ